MQNYLIEILLGLNLVAVLYLIVIGSFGRENASQQDMQQIILGKQKNLVREINELKGTMEHYQLLVHKESEKWTAERQALESPVQATTKSKNQQNLLLNDRYKEIFDLHAQGLSVDEIAKKLEKGCGEVTFILELAAQEHA